LLLFHQSFCDGPLQQATLRIDCGPSQPNYCEGPGSSTLAGSTPIYVYLSNMIARRNSALSCHVIVIIVILQYICGAVYWRSLYWYQSSVFRRI